MANPTLMRVRSPLSLAHIRQLFPSGGNDKVASFIPIMPMDYYYRRHDFDTAIQTAHWSVDNTGTSPTDFAFNAQRGGALRGATGTTTNNLIAVYHAVAPTFDAADKPWMIVRYKAPAAVTSFVYEIGFTDAKTDESLVSVTDIDTPTFTANGVTDGIVVAMDTAQTLTTSALVAAGSTGADAKTDIGTYTPTASKWQEILVGFEANRGFCQIIDDGVFVGEFTVAQGPDAAVLVRPSLIFKTLNSTSKVIDIDLIVLGSERNAS